MMRRLLPALLLPVLLLSAAGRALAHGDTVWANDDYGDFRLVVQSGLDTSTGNLRLTVLVYEMDFGPPVADAQVRVQAVPQGFSWGGGPVDVALPAEANQPGYYESLLPISSDGDWQTTVTVRRAAQSGTLTFPMALRGINDPGMFLWVAALLPLVAGLGAYFYFRRPEPATVEATAGAEGTDEADGGAP